MEDIKAKVTQDIVDSIIDDVKLETHEINTQFSQRLQRELDAYREKKTAVVNAKLALLEEAANKQNFKLESELRFENDKHLRNERMAMLTAFETRLKSDLEAFLKSDDYPKFIQDVCRHFEATMDMKDGLVKVRKDDAQWVKTSGSVEYSELSMGGIIIEIGNNIFDYSLATRFEDAMHQFVNKCKVNI